MDSGTVPASEAPASDSSGGAFINSLKRNNKQIRDDRASSIAEDTELVYKRTIEDLEISIRRMKREQENLLDLSPTSADSLVPASDFHSEGFVNHDIALAKSITEAQLRLDIAKQRYAYLFG